MTKIFNFLSTPKGLITLGLIGLAIGILIGYNWETIKGWFSSDNQKRMAFKNIKSVTIVKCRDAAGNYVQYGGKCGEAGYQHTYL